MRERVSGAILMVVLVIVCLTQWDFAYAQAPKDRPGTIRGKIGAVEGSSLKVATKAGDVLVRFGDDVRVSGVAEAKLSDITEGNYVGTTAVKQADGNLKALEVHIFPESSRGTGEDIDHGTYSRARP